MPNDNDKSKSQTPTPPAANPAAPPDDATEKAEAAAKARAAEQAEANLLREKAAEAVADGKSEFKVAPGTSITCKRGHIDENQSIFVTDFHGGEKDLADLVRRGAIVKAK